MKNPYLMQGYPIPSNNPFFDNVSKFTVHSKTDPNIVTLLDKYLYKTDIKIICKS